MISKLKRQMYFSLPVERFFTILLILFTLSCIFPFIFVIVISLTDEKHYNSTVTNYCRLNGALMHINT